VLLVITMVISLFRWPHPARAPAQGD